MDMFIQFSIAVFILCAGASLLIWSFSPVVWARRRSPHNSNG